MTTGVLRAACLVVGLQIGCVAPALASDTIHAVKIGALAHDVPGLWSGFQLEDDSVVLNGEIQFAPHWTLPWGVLRPAIGGSLNFQGDTSSAYADLLWQIDGPSGLFFSLGLGAAVHDGELKPVDPEAKALGSRVLFHIPIEIGVRLDAHNDISVYFEHISNASLADFNEGMDRLGVRYGYRF